MDSRIEGVAVLIAENFLEQGLAQVFDGKSAGTRMTLDDITTAWSKVGLRQSDLRDALSEMVERHYLVIRNEMGRLSFSLTEQGAIRFYICLYCEDNLQERLGSQREIQDESAARDALLRCWDRRSTQY